MKTTTLALLIAINCTCLFAQDPEKFYDSALEKAQAGDFEEAIVLFNKTIQLQPDNYYAFYNRGITKSILGLYEEALLDYEETVRLAPDYKKGYLNRGITKKRLTDYEGAMADYSYAISLDTAYSEAYYNRGIVYELLGKKDSACADFAVAKEFGLKPAERKVEKCNDTTSSGRNINPILRLTKTATSDKYGFTSEDPVMAGTGPDGGPGNQHAYLDLLRDAQGKPIKYHRLASCCGYKSKNAMIGDFALLDKYEIIYLDERGKEQKAVVYISFYDYEEPKILFGFKTVGQK